MIHDTPLFDLLILINDFYHQRPEYMPAVNELILALAEDRPPVMPSGCDWRIWREVTDVWKEVQK